MRKVYLILSLVLAVVLVACSGAAEPTPTPAEIAEVTEAIDASPEAEITEETAEPEITAEATAEATELMEMTEEATAEATEAMEVTAEVTAEATAEATDVMLIDEDMVAIEVSGAADYELTEGELVCETTRFGVDELPSYSVVAGDTLESVVRITLPRDLSADTYDILGTAADEDDEAFEDDVILVEFYFNEAAGDISTQQLYNEAASGEVILDLIPDDEGDRLTGSIDASLENEDGDTMMIAGTFSYELTDLILSSCDTAEETPEPVS